MTFSIHDTTGWKWEQIEPHWHDLLGAMERLVARFPSDMTVPALVDECRRGERTLWLVLEDGKFISFAMTNLRTVEATGAKIATCSDLAGERVFEYFDELNAALEAWADAKGGPDTIKTIEGRDGWRRPLAKYGYRPYAVLYRKVA